VLACFESEDRLTAFFEPLVIGLILVANATVGVLQEQKAEAAIEALKAYEADTAVVVREGQVKQIPASELVVGDVVEVAVGQQVPAELRLLEVLSVSLRVDQSALTGESVSVAKEVAALAEPRGGQELMIQDKHNMLFKGTNVVLGRARGLVVAVGERTEIGKISTQLQLREETQSPLQQRLDEFGDLLSKVITIICVLVWVMNIGHFFDPEHGNVLRGAVYYFKIAVALAVAAIPEGLPAVVTTCLALGTQKMARRQAIVRNLPAVETLGCTTVICSDKTGTLTTNKMSVCRVFYLRRAGGGGGGGEGDAELADFLVEGTSYAPEGRLLELPSQCVLERPHERACLAGVAEIGALANEASIVYEEQTRSYERIGEPTEVAIRVLVEKIGAAGLDRAAITDPREAASAASRRYQQPYRRLATLEFSRDRKSMSVLVHEEASGRRSLLVKGAPENLLARSTHLLLESADGREAREVPLTEPLRQRVLAQLARLGEDALRCIAFARRDGMPEPAQLPLQDPTRFAEVESQLTFVGVCGMMDPPRPDVPRAIATCRAAGIRVIVITGDNKLTAEAICRRIGIFDPTQTDLQGLSYTGAEFDRLSPEEQRRAVARARLFSRTEPIHKSRLVEMLRARGEVVAMTGDGVNDAPALKAADIGIAMGSGTSVAKCASKMVLADDNFATIVGAVEEGRAIYNNTKQFIRYLISSNIGEVVCIFLTAALGLPEALIPVQLLWVNLVTDGLPATALGFNPPERDIMRRAPRGKDDPIVSGWMFFRYLVIGAYVGIATVAGAAYWFLAHPGGPRLTWAQLTAHHACPPGGVLDGVDCAVFQDLTPSTISLSVLVTIEMFNALNSVSENQSILVQPPLANPWLLLAVLLSFLLHFAILYVPFLAHIFAVTPLGWPEWRIVLAFSAPVILLDEILKLIARIFGLGLRPLSSKAKID
jgi:Ca2+ transporting ATPase